jgi:hypothetical protein
MPVSTPSHERRQFLGMSLPTWIGALAAAAAAAVAVVTLVLSLTSHSPAVSSATRQSIPSSQALSVGDATNGGVWTRSNPDEGTVPGLNVKPANGITWLKNGRVIHPVCTMRGAPYPVTLHVTEHQTWYWWARLHGNVWVPTATIEQTTVDGPFGLPQCKSR